MVGMLEHMDLPGTAAQLFVVLLFVVPGSVYQAARSRLRGPTLDDVLPSARILRALAVSAFLDTWYAVVFGPTVVRLFGRSSERRLQSAGFASHPRATGVMALLLLFVIPIAGALAEYWLRNRGWRFRLSYDPTPRAWDFAFAGVEPTFVRLLTSDGKWLGGWYGENSFVSSFPEPREIFIERAHEIKPDGTFGRKQPGSNGLYVRCDDIRAVEIVDRRFAVEKEMRATVQEVDGGDAAR